MRAALLLLLAAAAADPAPAERAFVEVDAGDTAPYVHEPVVVTVRVGIDTDWFAENVVADSLREPDVPVRVRAPWFAEPPAEVTVERLADGERELVVGDGLAVARDAGVEERDGRRFRVVEVDHRVVFGAAGARRVEAPSLSFAHVDRFGFNALGERVPLGRSEVVVPGEPLLVEVRPLPETDRPASFTGAVGRFRLAASAPDTAGRVGESLRLVVRIEGEGNLATCDPPVLDDPGFHVRGVLDDRGAEVRTITWDLAPRSPSVTALPAVRWAWFDPAAEAWRDGATDAIPVTVAPGATLDEPVSPAVSAPPSGDDEVPDGSDPWPLVLLAAVVVVAVAVVGWRMRALEQPAAPAPAAGPRPDLEHALAHGVDPADALADWLAAHLGCTRAAVIGPDLERRLVNRGIPVDEAAAAAAALERLVAIRYGGAAPADPAAAARAAADRLRPLLGGGPPGA